MVKVLILVKIGTEITYPKNLGKNLYLQISASRYTALPVRIRAQIYFLSHFDQSIDEKQQRELTQFLNSLRRNASLFDASLILFDPCAINLVLIELEKELRGLLKDMRIPKTSDRVRQFF